jgi:shikimate kinase/3-dehydroquinate synthase
MNVRAKIVEEDPHDKGLRHLLNLGHTIGHCIEIVDGIPHGIAVAKGIVAATDLSVKFGYAEAELSVQVNEIISAFIPNLEYKLDERHFELLKNDKKKTGDLINFVFLLNIGEPLIVKVAMSDIINALRS